MQKSAFSVKMPDLIFFLISFLGPNVFLYVVSYQLGLSRSLINIDFVFASVAFVFGFRFLGFFIAFFVVFVEALVLFSQVFPIISMADVLALLSFIPEAPFFYQQIAYVSLFVFFVIPFVVSLSRNVSISTSIILFNFFVFSFLIEQFLYYDSRKESWRMVDGDRYVYSQVNYFLRHRLSGFVDQFSGDAGLYEMPIEGDGSVLNSYVKSQPSSRILFVISESWGESASAEINSKYSEIFNIDGYSFEYGSFSYDQATLRAELKELCGLVSIALTLPENLEPLNSCIPNHLKKLGYKTLSFHGAPGRMYKRNEFYPEVGFDNSFFLDNSGWTTHCYSFPGACDYEVLDDILNKAPVSGKSFIYWLTLNSHSPYDERDIHMDGFDCVEFGIDSNFVCNSHRLQYQNLYSLSDYIRKDGGFYDLGYDIVIVGDHPPRFFDMDVYKNNFTGNIPYIILRKNSNAFEISFSH